MRIPRPSRALRLLVAAVMSLALTIGVMPARPAAAHYFCQVWPFTPHTLLNLPLWDQINRALYPEFGDSVSAWNTSPTAAYFSSGSQSNYLVNAANAAYGNTGWDGYGGVHGLCGNATDGFALLNDTTLPSTSSGHKHYVEAHELGHSLTLDHADGYVSVMTTTTDVYTTPQQHETDDMNARYVWP